MNGMLVTRNPEPEAFRAISHPAWRRMLDLLAEAVSRVKAIAEHFTMGRASVSRHRDVLRDPGLVTEPRGGRARRYRLVPVRLGPVRDRVGHYGPFWHGTLQRRQKHLTKGKER